MRSVWVQNNNFCKVVDLPKFSTFYFPFVSCNIISWHLCLFLWCLSDFITSLFYKLWFQYWFSWHTETLPLYNSPSPRRNYPPRQRIYSKRFFKAFIQSGTPYTPFTRFQARTREVLKSTMESRILECSQLSRKRQHLVRDKVVAYGSLVA